MLSNWTDLKTKVTDQYGGIGPTSRMRESRHSEVGAVLPNRYRRFPTLKAG